jgi:hypothetical protein
MAREREIRRLGSQGIAAYNVSTKGGTAMKLWTIALAGFILASCSTAYQPAGFMGGFSLTRLDENVFQVSFRGNGYTRQERANDLALLRSAEVALEHGYPYFAIDGQRYAEHAKWTAPATSTTNLNATTHGNLYGGTYTGNTYGTATTTTYGGQTHIIRRPTASNTILGFKEKPEGFAYNAAFIAKSMKEKYRLE